MPVFDALDGPQHASLGRAVHGRRLRGWALMLVGLAGLVVLLAAGEEYETVGAVVTGLVLTPVFWAFDGRGLRQRLAKARPATAQATIEAAGPKRLLLGPAFIAVLIGLTVVTGFATPPVGVALAIGASDLLVAGTLGRWEREHGKTLLAVAGSSSGELFSR